MDKRQVAQALVRLAKQLTVAKDEIVGKPVTLTKRNMKPGIYIREKKHPQWGIWHVLDPKYYGGDWILSRSGRASDRRGLNESEFKFWEVVKPSWNKNDSKNTIAGRTRRAGVAETILKQMGGAGRLKAMIGAHSFTTSGSDLSFVFPNRKRSKGNAVRVTYNAGTDLYEMRFSNVSVAGAKVVAKFDDMFWEDLIETFERQTGLALRL